MVNQDPEVGNQSSEDKAPVRRKRPALWLAVALGALVLAGITYSNWRSIDRFCRTPAACFKITALGLNTQRCVFYEKGDTSPRTFLIPARTRHILNDVYVNRRIGSSPSLALAQVGPALDALFYLQKQSGIAINSSGLGDLFYKRNREAALELIVPAGDELAGNLQRRQRRIAFFDTAARLLETPPEDNSDALKAVLPDAPLLTGGLEPIFTLALLNEGEHPLFVEEVVAEIVDSAARTAPTPREPIPKKEVLDLRITARPNFYRHPLRVPLELAPKSEDEISIRLISSETTEHRYELKFSARGAGFEASTEVFLLRM
jgi:hypothetical protein